MTEEQLPSNSKTPRVRREMPKGEKAEKAGDEPERPKFEKLIEGEVTRSKKSLGRKIKDLFDPEDMKTTAAYVVREVLIPAGKDMLFDSVMRGVGRTVYGENGAPRPMRRHPGDRDRETRFSYNGISRDPRTRRRAMQASYENSAPIRQNRDEYILASHEEATMILEQLNDVIDAYGYVSINDLNEMLGLESVSHTDVKWGWGFLVGTPIRKVRDGWLLDLPPAEPMRR